MKLWQQPGCDKDDYFNYNLDKRSPGFTVINFCLEVTAISYHKKFNAVLIKLTLLPTETNLKNVAKVYIFRTCHKFL